MNNWQTGPFLLLCLVLGAGGTAITLAPTQPLCIREEIGARLEGSVVPEIRFRTSAFGRSLVTNNRLETTGAIDCIVLCSLTRRSDNCMSASLHVLPSGKKECVLFAGDTKTGGKLTRPRTELAESWTHFEYSTDCFLTTTATTDQSFQPWQQWSSCSAQCGGGVKLRQRLCKPELLKSGFSSAWSCFSVDYDLCNTVKCRVNGNTIVTSLSGLQLSLNGTLVTTGTPICAQQRPGFAVSNTNPLKAIEVDNFMDCIQQCIEIVLDCRITVVHQEISGRKTCFLFKPSATGATQIIQPRTQTGERWDLFQLTANCGSISQQRTAGSVTGRNVSVTSTISFQQWAKWSSCSVSCGIGTKTRKRVCTNRNADSLGCSSVETEPCQRSTCIATIVGAVWSQWFQWTSCSATCASGLQSRFRICSKATGCEGPNNEIKSCILSALCPTELGWSQWTSCSVTCSQGIQTRFHDQFGTDSKVCTRISCIPSVGIWNSWLQWGTCSVTCGSGSQKRSRFCQFGRTCVGSAQENQQCSSEACSKPVAHSEWGQWTLWSACLEKCGGGLVTRSRTCLRGNCHGAKTEDKSCAVQSCPKQWGEWREWGACSLPCGPGEMTRNRDCVNGIERIDCIGKPIGAKPCLLRNCPIWADWAEWGVCSVTCGSGTKTRQRECINKTKELNCPGLHSISSLCSVPCAIWLSWENWGPCSTQCGSGIKERKRQCSNISNGLQCTGDAKSTKSCEVLNCPGWSLWESWSTCSTTCNSGKRKRTRHCRYQGKLTQNSDCSGNSDEMGDCIVARCPEWSLWSQWSTCSATCGRGNQFRTRMCSGIGCTGSIMDNQTCETSACGIWNQWSNWNSCSVTCGSGIQKRSRLCTNPGQCEGLSETSQVCNAGMCPSWGLWETWSACTVSCGGGTKIRTRTCSMGTNLCIGQSDETKICNEAKCPYWQQWQAWTSCSASCGAGEKLRFRNCFGGNCIGDYIENETCNAGPCPAAAAVALWGKWSACSVTCGQGFQTRQNNCEMLNNAKECIDSATSRRVCGKGSCAQWTNWAAWTRCSVSCGGGKQTRSRNCMSGSIILDNVCSGSNVESTRCNELSCPGWSQWSRWSVCTVTCGTGQKMRKRDCYGGRCEGNFFENTDCEMTKCAYWLDWTKWTECNVNSGMNIQQKRSRKCSGQGCIGNSIDTKPCRNIFDQSWSQWNAWSACSSSCNGGTRSRRRTCLIENSCDGNSVQTEDCGKTPCPSWTQWSVWSQCSVTCGNGKKGRTRDCFGGNCVGKPLETAACNNEDCERSSFQIEETSILFQYSQWTSWTTCSASCGIGTTTRSRACTGSQCVENLFDSRSCNLTPCTSFETRLEPWSSDSFANFGSPGLSISQGTESFGSQNRGIQGASNNLGSQNTRTSQSRRNLENANRWTSWETWSDCSVTCGVGIWQRTRICSGGNCLGNRIEFEPCNPGECASWAIWERWSLCSVSCGPGIKRRVRSCSGSQCLGESTATSSCNLGQCPAWGDWGEWTSCSSSCGQGNQIRSRLCNGFGCPGSSTESTICNLGTCPQWLDWSSWSTCSASCGQGRWTRHRSCSGSQCFGSNSESTSCNVSPCPSWTQWAEWSQCSASCGKGYQVKSRICIGGTAEQCVGNSREFADCQIGSCARLMEWSSWSPCSVSCGTGQRTRTRSCTGGLCQGALNEIMTCQQVECQQFSEWSQWGAWSSCSVTCSKGIQFRSKQCAGNNCIGSLPREEQACDAGACFPFWTKWGQWSSCSKSCGQAIKVRRRTCLGGTSNSNFCGGPYRDYGDCILRPCVQFV